MLLLAIQVYLGLLSVLSPARVTRCEPVAACTP